MSDNSSRWLMGCAMGCAALLVVLGGLGLGGFFYIKGTIDHFKESGEALEELRTTYGRAEDFTPWLDGRIPPDRMESFLKVRELTAPDRARMAEGIRNIEEHIQRPDGGRPRGFWGALSAIRSGLGAVPVIAEFMKLRSEALMDAGMGAGEYQYLYMVGFYAYLGKSPGDGPLFLDMRDRHTAEWDPGNHPEDSRERREFEMTREVRQRMRRHLSNVLRAASVEGTDADREWISAVEAEIAALDQSPNRQPWADGLPGGLEESLAPYRERLEAAYDPVINALEFLTLDHE